MLTINNETYRILDEKTADRHETEGRLNTARFMRQNKIARELIMARPKGKQMFAVSQYESGEFTSVSFIGWL